MPRICTVCVHPKRHIIDKMLIRGDNVATIAAKFHLGQSSLYRHKSKHLSRQLVQGWDRKRKRENLDLLSELDDLLSKSKELLQEAESKGQLGIALQGVKESRSTLEFLSKIFLYLKETEKEGERLREQQRIEQLKTLSKQELESLLDITEKLENAPASATHVIDVTPAPAKPKQRKPIKKTFKEFIDDKEDKASLLDDDLDFEGLTSDQRQARRPRHEIAGINFPRKSRKRFKPKTFLDDAIVGTVRVSLL